MLFQDDPSYVLAARYDDCVPRYVTTRTTDWYNVHIPLWCDDRIPSTGTRPNVRYSMTDSTSSTISHVRPPVDDVK